MHTSAARTHAQAIDGTSIYRIFLRHWIFVLSLSLSSSTLMAIVAYIDRCDYAASTKTTNGKWKTDWGDVGVMLLFSIRKWKLLFSYFSMSAMVRTGRCQCWRMRFRVPFDSHLPMENGWACQGSVFNQRTKQQFQSLSNAYIHRHTQPTGPALSAALCCQTRIECAIERKSIYIPFIAPIFWLYLLYFERDENSIHAFRCSCWIWSRHVPFDLMRNTHYATVEVGKVNGNLHWRRWDACELKGVENFVLLWLTKSIDCFQTDDFREYFYFRFVIITNHILRWAEISNPWCGSNYRVDCVLIG